MRCSLLTLSSYLDRELPPERSGELEAHLIACPRCSTGLGYLREEAERIRALSQAHVPADAEQRLLVTVGLAAERAASGSAMAFDEPPTHPPVGPTASPEFALGGEPTFEFSPGLIGTAYPHEAPDPVAAGIDYDVEGGEEDLHEQPPLDLIDEEEAPPVRHDEPAQPDGDVVEVAGTAMRLASPNGWPSAAPPVQAPPAAPPLVAQPPIAAPPAVAVVDSMPQV